MKMLEDVIAAAGGCVKSRMRLIKLAFLVDYEHYKAYGQKLSKYEWVDHYYGPYSFDLMKNLHNLVNDGVIIESYDDCEGVYLYYVPREYGPKEFVARTVKKYSKESTQELKEHCYSILKKEGVKPGEKIF